MQTIPMKSSFQKGIILAAGAGTRLRPSTLVTNKQLLPIYDKPMVYYPLATLVESGIHRILIISDEDSCGGFQKLLGDGSRFGLSIEYTVQLVRRGIADAFLIARDFIASDPIVLILGDNIFYGRDFASTLQKVSKRSGGATVFGIPVHDPERYGVVEFDRRGQALSLEEKPQRPKSNYAVPGLYFYDNQVIEIAEHLKPSARGELEITDVNREYLDRGELHVEPLPDDFDWFDTGTTESMFEATQFVRSIVRSGRQIGCVEESAYRHGLMNSHQLSRAADETKNEYGDYLRFLVTQQEPAKKAC